MAVTFVPEQQQIMMADFSKIALSGQQFPSVSSQQTLQLTYSLLRISRYARYPYILARYDPACRNKLPCNQTDSSDIPHAIFFAYATKSRYRSRDGPPGMLGGFRRIYTKSSTRTLPHIFFL